MANAMRGEVPLKVGDQTYTLLLSINALCELESETGVPVPQLAESLNKPENVRLTTVRAIVWAALQERHPKVTLKDAGAIIHEAGLPAVMDAIGQAFQSAFPEATGEQEQNPRKAKA